MIRGRIRYTAATSVLVFGLGLANAPSAQTPSGTRAPDPKRGAVIATQGAAAGAPGCARCHAFDGSSDGTGAFPRVAGQSAYYLAKQLRDFASNVRANAIMTPIAKALTPDDIADLAAYYAGLDPPFLPLRNPDPALVKAGEQLAKVGSEARGIQACDNCHGPGGVGERPAIPYLAGQYAARLPQEQPRADGRGGQAAQRPGNRGSRGLLPAGARSRWSRGIAVRGLMSTGCR
jgi:cytochrome c553